MSNRDVLALIEQADLLGWESLTLSNLGLTALPPEIGRLTSLVSLDLSGNRLHTLPEEIGRLTDLQALDLGPARSQGSANLGSGVGGNQLTELPAAFAKLTELRLLVLKGNRLRDLPDCFGRMPQLRLLDISNNQLTALPDSVTQLKQLVTLNAANNAIAALPDHFDRLNRLATLDLSNNALTRLPKHIGRMTALRTLDIGNPLRATYRVSDDSAEAPELVEAHNNTVAALPASIVDLPRLAQLFASGNRITALPDGMGQLKTLRQLDLPGNPLPMPPEILARPHLPHIIVRFYRDAQALPPEVRLNEARLIVVGPRGAGKTTLINRLCHTETGATARHSATWTVTAGAESVRVSLWERNTGVLETPHQLWRSRRALYLLVADATRQETDNDVAQWLALLQSFAPAAPVIVADNKQDIGRYPLAPATAQTQHPQVRGVHAVSAADDAGYDALRAALVGQIGALAHINDPVPRAWYQMRMQLEADVRPTLSFEEFCALCKSQGLDDQQSQRALLQFVTDIDVVVPLLSAETRDIAHVVRHRWLVRAVGLLLHASGSGRFSRDELAAALPEADYPRNSFAVLMAALEQLGIGYAQRAADGVSVELVLPQRLPDAPPAAISMPPETEDAVRLWYDFRVLPHSILAHCAVRLRASLPPKQLWRNGLVLQRDGCRCVLAADSAEARLILTVTGPAEPARRLLALVRTHLVRLMHDLPGLDGTCRVMLSADGALSESLDRLLTLEQMGVQQFVPEGAQHALDVGTVLDRIVSPQVRRHAARPLVDQANVDATPERNRTQLEWDRESAESQLIHLRRVRGLVEKHTQATVRSRLLLTTAAAVIAALLILQLTFLGVGRWILIGGGMLVAYLWLARRFQTVSPTRMVDVMRNRIRHDIYAEIDFDQPLYRKLEDEYGFHEPLL